MHQDSEPLADSELIARVVRGDVQAYGVLVQWYERGVLGAVLPMVHNFDAARDVVQDAFVQCYVKLASLRDPSRFGVWLMTIAKREASRTARRQRRMRAAPLPDVAIDPQ